MRRQTWGEYRNIRQKQKTATCQVHLYYLCIGTRFSHITRLAMCACQVPPSIPASVCQASRERQKTGTHFVMPRGEKWRKVVKMQTLRETYLLELFKTTVICLTVSSGWNCLCVEILGFKFSPSAVFTPNASRLLLGLSSLLSFPCWTLLTTAVFYLPSPFLHFPSLKIVREALYLIQRFPKMSQIKLSGDMTQLH